MLHKTDYYIEIPNDNFLIDNKKQVLNEPTGDFFYDPWIIKKEYKDTFWEDLLNSLPLDKGEARLIKLTPGESYMAHADIDDRWHLNLQGNLSYIIDLDNEKMHLLKTDGFWYDMDAGRLHAATNYGSIDRYQLVIRKLLIKNVLKNPSSFKISIDNPDYDYRYKFDYTISPWLNKANKKEIITNFVFNPNHVTFDVETEFIDELIRIIPTEFDYEY